MGGKRSRVGKAKDYRYEAEVEARRPDRVMEAEAKRWGQVGALLRDEMLTRGGRSDAGHQLRHVMVTMCLRLLEPHREALDTARRLGGVEKVAGLAKALLEPMLAEPQGRPGDWVIMPMATGTRAAGDKAYGEQEVSVAPLMFGRARITLGPVGRQFLDEWWEYPTTADAVAAFAEWQCRGWADTPKGYDKASQRCMTLRYHVQHCDHPCNHPDHEGSDAEDA